MQNCRVFQSRAFNCIVDCSRAEYYGAECCIAEYRISEYCKVPYDRVLQSRVLQNSQCWCFHMSHVYCCDKVVPTLLCAVLGHQNQAVAHIVHIFYKTENRPYNNELKGHSPAKVNYSQEKFSFFFKFLLNPKLFLVLMRKSSCKSEREIFSLMLISPKHPECLFVFF